MQQWLRRLLDHQLYNLQEQTDGWTTEPLETVIVHAYVEDVCTSVYHPDQVWVSAAGLAPAASDHTTATALPGATDTLPLPLPPREEERICCHRDPPALLTTTISPASDPLEERLLESGRDERHASLNNKCEGFQSPLHHAGPSHLRWKQRSASENNRFVDV
ncbi:hypothetical protein AAFF_G00263650 [Aldrovandia affinis]|uniref:Uncharacterized protein n=1 Tax=Aldrovandia affinis TaxID=143900 RepID=A0AAD7SSP8_9TELE|nr:hypothetical protein AAFF_G00263650 [Aldrovandia affinis]